MIISVTLLCLRPYRPKTQTNIPLIKYLSEKMSLYKQTNRRYKYDNNFKTNIRHRGKYFRRDSDQALSHLIKAYIKVVQV